MTTTEPTPEAVEELARVKGQHRYVDVRGDYEVGDGRRYFGCTCGWTHDVDGMSGYWSWVEEQERHAAREVLAAGYVDHGTYAGAAMARDAAEKMHDRATAENDSLRAQGARVEALLADWRSLPVYPDECGEMVLDGVHRDELLADLRHALDGAERPRPSRAPKGKRS